MTNYINAQLPNNTSRQITPANVRNSDLAIVNNFSTIPYSGQISTSYDITSTATVTGGFFVGDGSGLTNVSATSAGSVNWYNILNTPLVLQNISNSTGSVTVTTLTATLASATTTSGTFGYFRSISGSGIGITGVNASTAQAVSWSNVQNVPSVLQNISNSTGSVTVTSINATTGTFTNVSAGAVTATTLSGTLVSGPQNGITSINAATILSTTNLSATVADIPTLRAIQVSTTNISASLVDVTRGGTVSATNGYFTNISGSGAGITGVTASPGGPSGSIQFNLAGSTTSGSTNFVTVNNQIGMGIASPNAKLDVNGIISSTGNSITGAITATTTIQGGTISATAAGLYTTAISASGLTFLNTVSTTGFVSNSATFSNYMRERKLVVAATTATTVLNFGLATEFYVNLASTTTISTSNVDYTNANVAVMIACQDGTGAENVTWPANARFNLSISPTQTTTANTCTRYNLTPVSGTLIWVEQGAKGVSAT